MAADVRLELDLVAFEQAFVMVGVLGQARDPAVALRGGQPLYDADRSDFEIDATEAPATGGGYINSAILATLTPAATSIQVDKFIYFTKKKDIDAAASSWNKNTAITLSNFDLKLEYIEVAADVQSAIEAATGGEYAMSFDSWSCFTNTVKSESNALTQPIGSKFSSIKTFNTIFRPASHINNIRWHGISSRVDPFSHELDRRSHGSMNVTTHPQPYRPGVG